MPAGPVPAPPGGTATRLAVVGGPGTGRTTILLDRARALAAAGAATVSPGRPGAAGVSPGPAAGAAGVTFVAATAGAARALLDRLATAGAAAALVDRLGPAPAVAVTTPAALARDVLDATARPLRPVGPGVVEAEVAAELARLDPDRWAHLAARAAQRDLAGEVVAAWALSPAPGAPGPHHEALALAEQVRARLAERGWTDGDGMLRAAAAAVSASTTGAALPRHLLVDDLDRLRAPARELLAAVASRAETWAVAGSEVDGWDPAGPGWDPQEVVHLEALHRQPPAQTLTVCDHPSLEPEVAAGRLLAARARGVAWDDLALVVVGRDRPLHPLVRALRRHGIPAAAGLDGPPSPPARRLLATLAWLAGTAEGPAPGDAGIAGSLQADRDAGADPPALALATWARVVAPDLDARTRAAQAGPDDAALDEVTALVASVSEHVAARPRATLAEVVAALAGHRGRAARPQGAGVAVVRPGEAVGREWDTVVVVGAVEGALPDPRLPAAGLLGATPERRAAHLAAERARWDLVASRARRSLEVVAAPRPGVLVSRWAAGLHERQPHLPFAPGGATPALAPTTNALGVLGSRPLALSASQLETYADCPLRYAYDHGVRAAGPAGLAADLGSVVHQVLARFLDPGGGIPRTWEALGALAESCWDDHIAPWRPQVVQLRRDYLGMLGAWWEGEGDPALGALAEVVAVEHRFDVEVAGHRLRGAIDRVDRLPDGTLAVVDYKTGRSEPRDVADNLQLAVYHLAATRDPALAELGPVSLLRLRYLRSMRAHDQPIALDHEARTTARVAAAAAAILEERFEPGLDPDCRTCSYQRLCPLHPEGRQVGDP